ncbi:MAG: hypothetical protein F4X76_06020 [Chloroflexi bacterium]|nr:hypothetical protein [Chloroflexota bacterium]
MTESGLRCPHDRPSGPGPRAGRARPGAGAAADARRRRRRPRPAQGAARGAATPRGLHLRRCGARREARRGAARAAARRRRGLARLRRIAPRRGRFSARG